MMIPLKEGKMKMINGRSFVTEMTTVWANFALVILPLVIAGIFMLSQIAFETILVEGGKETQVGNVHI